MTIERDGAGLGSLEDAKLSAADRERARHLYAYLRGFACGEGEAKTVAEIAEWMEVSARKVRTLVTYLRENRCPILATPDAGYFWPEFESEGEHTLEFLTKRIHSTVRAREGIREGLEEVFRGEFQLELGE